MRIVCQVRHDIRRLAPFAGVLLFGVASAAPAAIAQPRPTVGRVTLTTIGPENLCAQEERAGERLARVPEGFALLRMRSELDAVARLESVRPTTPSASARSTAQRLASVRREVDTLTRRLEALLASAPLADPAVASGAARTEARRALTARVRELVPTVDGVVETALSRVAGFPVRAPAGYLGLTMSSVPMRSSLQSGYIVSYCDYPIVESVDPGSPAERAGLASGDTILAFNGRDVRAGMVDYTTLLEPARRLGVRVRRDGRVRDVTLTVGTRPEPTAVRLYARATTAAPMRATDLDVPTSMPVALAAELANVRADQERVGILSVAPAPARATPSPVMITIFTGDDDAMVGGAQLKTLGSELRTALGLTEGVLVLQVLPGTPAAVGGLREGDVIREANGLLVRAVRDVRVALEAARASRTLSLRVGRNDASERTVQLKW